MIAVECPRNVRRALHCAVAKRSLGNTSLLFSSAFIVSVGRADFNAADEPFQYPSRFYRIAKKESDYCSLPCASPCSRDSPPSPVLYNAQGGEQIRNRALALCLPPCASCRTLWPREKRSREYLQKQVG